MIAGYGLVTKALRVSAPTGCPSGLRRSTFRQDRRSTVELPPE